MEPQTVKEARERLQKHGISGPWDAEPDRVEWKSATGLDCLMVRHKSSLHWCGYVGVPKNHPDHGRFYDDVDVDVHGGLTYADRCRGDVCHDADDGGSVWWLGFDCAHAWDLIPFHLAFKYEIPNSAGLFEAKDDTYRNVGYVKSEVENLALQLKKRGTLWRRVTMMIRTKFRRIKLLN